MEPLPPKDDWSEVEAVEKAFRDRDSGVTKAIVLRAQAMKILAVGVSIALIFVGLSFLRPDIFPKVWAPSQTTITLESQQGDAPPNGDKLAEDSQSSRPKNLDGNVTISPPEPPPSVSDSHIWNGEQTSGESEATTTRPVPPLPPQGEPKQDTIPESLPNPLPQPKSITINDPDTAPASQQDAIIIRDPNPAPSRHAPGSLAARLEQVIEGGQKTFTPKQFTQSEEFKTAEYHGQLETIRDGKVIFREGKVFEPINKNNVITTSKYDGDYAYCRQSSHNENRYYCRVLHEGVEEKI